MRSFIFASLLIFAGCEGNKSSTIKNSIASDTSHRQATAPAGKKETPQESTDPVNSTVHCYMKTSGRDTVLLQFEQAGNSVTGRLKYDNYQYDGSSGTVMGAVEGDLIKLWYEFNAEGTHTVRQVFFKITDDRLLSGTGTLVTRGDTSAFKDPSAVHFGENDFYRQMDCELVKPGF